MSRTLRPPDVRSCRSCWKTFTAQPSFVVEVPAGHFDVSGRGPTAEANAALRARCSADRPEQRLRRRVHGSCELLLRANPLWRRAELRPLRAGRLEITGSGTRGSS